MRQHHFYLLVSSTGSILADAADPLLAMAKRHEFHDDHGIKASVYACTLVDGDPVADIAACFTNVVAPVEQTPEVAA